MDFKSGINIPRKIPRWINWLNACIPGFHKFFIFGGEIRRGLTGESLMGYAFRQYGESVRFLVPILKEGWHAFFEREASYCDARPDEGAADRGMRHA